MATATLITLIIIVLLALVFDFINGFHDTANAIATSISTRALSPKIAVLYAAVLNLFGAVVSNGVAQTIGGKIADPAKLANGSHIVIAALISAIIWNLLTWYFGIPSSSSHTLIGSVAGAVMAGGGTVAVNWSGFARIVEILILSPIIAFAAGFLIMYLMKFIVIATGNSSRTKYNRGFRSLQIVSAGLLSFSHGGNDAQKAMGIIVFALVTTGVQTDIQHVPLWVKLAAGVAMGLGTSIGGWRIIKTVSRSLVRIEPINGFASDLTSSLVIQTSTALSMPLSTTHVISSSVLGTGSALRPHDVKWGTVKRMLTTWVITIPISIALSYLIYYALFGWL